MRAPSTTSASARPRERQAGATERDLSAAVEDRAHLTFDRVGGAGWILAGASRVDTVADEEQVDPLAAPQESRLQDAARLYGPSLPYGGFSNK